MEIEFRTVIDKSAEGFDEQVTVSLNDGFLLVGGPYVIHRDGVDLFAQSMVKQEVKTDEQA